MQDDAIRTATIHPVFTPVTRLKYSYGKISSWLTEISGTEPARPLALFFFFYISLPSLHDYDVKFPNFTFCGGRESKTTSFLFT